jgi:hypothetical protein
MQRTQRIQVGIRKGRGYTKRPSSLEDKIQGKEKERKEKERQKERFKAAGWEKIDNVKKYQWRRITVPVEVQKMTLQLPDR